MTEERYPKHNLPKRGEQELNTRRTVQRHISYIVGCTKMHSMNRRIKRASRSWKFKFLDQFKFSWIKPVWKMRQISIINGGAQTYYWLQYALLESLHLKLSKFLKPKRPSRKFRQPFDQVSRHRHGLPVWVSVRKFLAAPTTSPHHAFLAAMAKSSTQSLTGRYITQWTARHANVCSPSTLWLRELSSNTILDNPSAQDGQSKGLVLPYGWRG